MQIQTGTITYMLQAFLPLDHCKSKKEQMDYLNSASFLIHLEYMRFLILEDNSCIAISNNIVFCCGSF